MAQIGRETTSSTLQKRLTIGFLAHSVNDDINGPRWLGVLDAARAQDCNVIIMNGGLYGTPSEFYAQANILYHFLTPETLDGVIVGSIFRKDMLSEAEIRAMYQRFSPHVINIQPLLPEIPSVPLDVYQGMRAAVIHLIEVHHRRRIAFLRGPAGHPYAEDRYRAYVDVVEEYHLPFDPLLVTPPCDWTNPSLLTLLDERHLRPGIDFDAVVAVSDVAMGLNSLTILAERGVRVPLDVAVVSFDDVREGRVHMPSLTTVRMPFYEQGQATVHLLLASIAGETTPQENPLAGQLVIRQSCGCLYPTVERALAGPITPSAESWEIALPARRDDILAAMAQPVKTTPEIRVWMGQLFDGFLAEMQGKGTGRWVLAWDAILSQVIGTTGDVGRWQDVLSTFRRLTLPSLTGTPQQALAEDLWGQVRVLIGESMQRERERYYVLSAQQNEILRQIERELMTTFDMAGLREVLTRTLPRLGIPACYLAVYDPLPDPSRSLQVPEWSRLILAYHDQGSMESDPQSRRFPTRQLVPPDLLPQHRLYQLHMEPLYFKEQQLGFILFEVGPREWMIYQMLQGQISSALQGGMLVQRVQQHSLELAAAYEEIKILNQQLEAENVRMSAELSVVKQLQQMILPRPQELTDIPGLDIVGYMQPADEVGGDYYDVLHEQGVLHIGIGDVTGHGLESGVIMLMTQAAIRTLIEHGETDPVKFVNTLNRLIYKNVARIGADKNLTFALVQYQEGQLKVVGQHEELLVVRQSGQIERLDTMLLGFPVGLVDDISAWVKSVTVVLQPGDGVVLYTDGIPEAENQERELYGIDRLCAVISQNWQKSVEEIKQAIVDDVMRHIGTQKIYDDLTLVVLKQE